MTALALIVVVALGAVALRRVLPRYRYGLTGTCDWVEYWSAARLMWSGQDPYDPDSMLRIQRSVGSELPGPILMWNPPWLLLWLSPVLFPSFPVSALGWMGLNIALLLVGALLARGVIPAGTRLEPRAAWLAAGLFVPALFALKSGQTSVIHLVGAAGFLWCATRGRDFVAGLFLALTSVKPHVVYLLWIVAAWWVVVRGRWWMAVGAATLLIGSAVITETLWPGVLADFRRAVAHPPLYWKTPTVGGLIRTLSPGIDPRWQFAPSLLVGSGTLAYLMVRRPSIDWRVVGPPILLLSVPTAAYGWSFDQIALLPAWLSLVSGALDPGRSPKARAGILATLILIAAIAAAQSIRRSDEVTFFWFGPALGLAYMAWVCNGSTYFNK